MKPGEPASLEVISHDGLMMFLLCIRRISVWIPAFAYALALECGQKLEFVW